VKLGNLGVQSLGTPSLEYPGDACMVEDEELILTVLPPELYDAEVYEAVLTLISPEALEYAEA